MHGHRPETHNYGPAQVTVPVTYADVWEYWLRNREVYEAVDFVTIHILPAAFFPSPRIHPDLSE